MRLFRQTYRHLSDETLMVRIAQGKTAAFDELYARYNGRLLHYFYRMLGGNGEKAQDFLQDLFLKLVEAPDRFCPERTFSSWVFTVAHNMCKNEYRRLHVRKNTIHPPNLDHIPDAEESDYHPIEQRVDHQSFQNALLKELDRLDENHRSTFLLRHQENLSIREISRVLGCSEGTTKSRLHYTTRKLAQKLKALNPYQPERPRDETLR